MIGGGAIGSLLAAHLSRRVSCALLSQSRPRHLQAIQDAGGILLHRANSSPTLARLTVCADAAELDRAWGAEQADVSVVAVKAHWLEAGIQRAAKVTRAGGAILCVQNGHNLDRVEANATADHKMMMGVTYNGATSPVPGSVHHNGSGASIGSCGGH